jgi:hypothetical protein
MKDADLSLVEKLDLTHIDIEHELSERGLAYNRTSGNNLYRQAIRIYRHLP